MNSIKDCDDVAVNLGKHDKRLIVNNDIFRKLRLKFGVYIVQILVISFYEYISVFIRILIFRGLSIMRKCGIIIQKQPFLSVK